MCDRDTTWEAVISDATESGFRSFG
jgi:hypothetical protein